MNHWYVTMPFPLERQADELAEGFREQYEEVEVMKGEYGYSVRYRGMKEEGKCVLD